MSKGDNTREMILDRTARLLNVRGYSGMAMSDVMQVTGLEKGGLYNHFKNKDDLAVAAFDYACQLVRRPVREAIATQTHPCDQLLAYIAVWQRMVDEPVLEGGCPILNMSAEADETHPELRDHAMRAMQDRRQSVVTIVQRGLASGEIKPDVDPEGLASFVVGALEGAILLKMLYGDSSHMRQTIAHLTQYVEGFVRA